MNMLIKRVIAFKNPRGDDNNNNNNKLSDLETLTDKCTTSPLTLMRVMAFFVVSFMLFSVLFSLSVVLRDPPSDAAISSTTTLFQLNQGMFLFSKTISFSQFSLPNFMNKIVDRISIVEIYLVIFV